MHLNGKGIYTILSCMVINEVGVAHDTIFIDTVLGVLQYRVNHIPSCDDC